MTNSTQTTTSLNPSTWNQGFRFDQAQLRPAPSRLLTIAGQCPITDDGELLHVGDTAAQLGAALDNVQRLLDTAQMTLHDVLRLVIYTTDMDGTLAGYQQVTSRLDAVGATPPCTLVEVTRLAVPGMAIEIDVTAGR